MNSCDECSEECKYSKECLGEGVRFERIRRITGYITGDYISRFNNAKKAEVEDRVTHNRYNRTEEYHDKE